MKLQFLPIVLLLFMNFHLEAQGNFKKGMIITNEGDTLKGYINDRSWDVNPEKIYFKDFMENADEKIFDLNNTRYFQIDGIASYQRFFLSVSMDEVHYDNLHIGVDTSKIKKTVFLKILVDGCYVNLYSYTDAIKSRYYYMEKENERPLELSYRTYYYKSPELTDRQKIMTVNNYRGQLKYLASKFGTDSKDVKHGIEDCRYLEDELSEIMVHINGNNALNFCRTIITGGRLRLFFYTGMYMERSFLGYFKAATCKIVNSESDHNVQWMPVPFIGFDLKKNTGSRLFIREELSFSYYDLTSSDTYTEAMNYYTNNYEYNLSQWNISLSNNLNYNFLYRSKLKAFLGAGIDMHFSVDVTTSYYAYGQGAYYNDSLEFHDILPPAHLWLSFPITVGVILKDKYDILYRYHIPINFSDAEMDSRLIESMEIGIAYLF
jgi:hypothetical protein